MYVNSFSCFEKYKYFYAYLTDWLVMKCAKNSWCILVQVNLLNKYDNNCVFRNKNKAINIRGLYNIRTDRSLEIAWLTT